MITTDLELLRTHCIDVLPEEIGPLREQLEAELKRSEQLGRPGIGLAAPQIGIFKKMAIVRLPSSKADFYSVDLVNVPGYKGFDPAKFEGEGCLSFPDTYETTWRYQEIYIAQNFAETGPIIATGLLAVAIQHELDHLSGVLLPDRVAMAKEFKI